MVRKRSLHDSGGGDLKDKSPQQCLGMMWQLALNAWSFKENLNAEPRLQRHVVLKNKLSAGRDKDQSDIAWLKKNQNADA